MGRHNAHSMQTMRFITCLHSILPWKGTKGTPDEAQHQLCEQNGDVTQAMDNSILHTIRVVHSANQTIP
eukprot:scaffold166087_cov23-Tisochrysis_lutea.AAC.3